MAHRVAVFLAEPLVGYELIPVHRADFLYVIFGREGPNLSGLKAGKDESMPFTMFGAQLVFMACSYLSRCLICFYHHGLWGQAMRACAV
ncbi:hypothetical protein HMPREF1870_00349 [Bacteroidales bacterium KA00344]|nr:hypothetical protein HMPREF1870_00349 [Bacteroidales bacterium KA00344]